MTENIHQRPIPITVGWGVYFRKSESQTKTGLPPSPSPLDPSHQSLHFENENPAKPMKTSHGKNFNRYTFTVLRRRLKPFHESRITNHKSRIRILPPGLEID